MDAIIDIVSNVAFPIAVSCFLFYYAFVDKKEAQKEQKEREERYIVILTELQKTVEYNTSTIKDLVERIDINANS
jgi:hypothetical protein|nr:MAG TPA: holin family protein [Caudoviricetes sp.]